MKSAPLTAYRETLGMVYFSRMVHKIRLNAEGTLRDDFTANLGSGFDGRCSGFLRVDYAEFVTRVLTGGTDEELLEWCFENGRRLDEGDIFIWNNYITRVGWKDGTSETLARRKRESGLESRDEIETMFEYFEYDEGRKA